MNVEWYQHLFEPCAHGANKPFKCLWMIITATAFSPIWHFCGEIAISLPNIRFGDQSFSFSDISLFVLHTVWPLLEGLEDITAGVQSIMTELA